ncbi:MAG: hypothetical protein E6H71_05295 [Betaproteobacteria bacterium]|nr:MAG: hypothetical protein E6H71_05295 [Betaproteobacteria bacterium]
MHSSDIYTKTELGVRELRERHLNLPLPLRSLLIMIDGNRTVANVLEKARALGLDDKAFETLAIQGLVAPKFSAPSAAVNGAMEPQRSEADVERYLRAQQMMSDAINSHLGFRGYGLMMRLQKAANLHELHDLLRDVAAVLVKRMGIDGATPIVSEIEQQIIARQ